MSNNANAARAAAIAADASRRDAAFNRWKALRQDDSAAPAAQDEYAAAVDAMNE